MTHKQYRQISARKDQTLSGSFAIWFGKHSYQIKFALLCDSGSAPLIEASTNEGCGNIRLLNIECATSDTPAKHVAHAALQRKSGGVAVATEAKHPRFNHLNCHRVGVALGEARVHRLPRQQQHAGFTRC
eukprot:SAG11_NODE_2967_length_2805_cov_1.906135_3_plen_130_part_00